MARTKIIAWSLLLLAFGHFPSVLFGAARRGTYLNYDTNDEMRSQHQNRHLEENAGGGYERDFRSTNGGSRAAEGHFHYMLVGAAREGRYHGSLSLKKGQSNALMQDIHLFLLLT